jgi:hypothetical protein
VRTGSIGGVIILIWLIIGAIAAGQRGYFANDDAGLGVRRSHPSADGWAPSELDRKHHT